MHGAINVNVFIWAVLSVFMIVSFSFLLYVFVNIDCVCDLKSKYTKPVTLWILYTKPVTLWILYTKPVTLWILYTKPITLWIL